MAPNAEAVADLLATGRVRLPEYSAGGSGAVVSKTRISGRSIGQEFLSSLQHPDRERLAAARRRFRPARMDKGAAGPLLRQTCRTLDLSEMIKERPARTRRFNRTRASSFMGRRDVSAGLANPMPPLRTRSSISFGESP